MVSPGGRKRLRSSLDSPSQPVNLEWVPEGMDLSSACRVALHIPNYVEISDGGRHISHGNRDFQLVVDRDTTNLKDLSADISALVKHGINQGMNLTFWDNEICTHSALTSDSILMDAFDMYWELRRLPLIVTIYDTMPIDNSHQQTSQSTEPVLQICGVEPSNIVADSGSVEPSGISIDKPKKAKKAKVGKSIRDDDERWIDDEVEYVGLNDEEAYLSDVEVNAEANYDPSDADSESGKDDELLVNDDDGCDVLEHVTNLENPTIALNVTFEDEDTFKRAIRQYAVLNEFEIAAPYSESTRYRGYCKGTQSKGKKCKWRIHASELQDGQTWQVGFLRFAQYGASSPTPDDQKAKKLKNKKVQNKKVKKQLLMNLLSE